MRRFILKEFDAPEPPVVLTEAHRTGYTRDESDRLASPLTLLSPRGLYWAINRASIRMGSWLSKGMGIGAYQAREYVRALGGDVEVQSSPGRGTRFLIRLPLAPELRSPAERANENRENVSLSR